ncbi:hypothetical protein RUM44_008570 [Polyplax serrata]|uniref:Tektin n=1 Tax=Polyplax serrata TaxID=468196 RepID=A0ABR1B8W1_POLSC
MGSTNFKIHFKPPTRYSVDQWYSHNRTEYQNTRDRGVSAETLIEQSGRLQDRVKESIVKKKSETDWLFKGRIQDIDFTRIELEKVRKTIQEELEALDILEERIQDEMKCVLGNAGEIVAQCIKFREGRAGIDLIHDEVERELEIEKKKIAEAGEMLKKALEQTKESKRDLRASLYLLNKDVKDKLKCLAIEVECLNLKESDSNLEIYTGNESFDKGNVSVEEWARYSEEIIKSSEKKIQAARLFGAHVKLLLDEIIGDLTDEYCRVNEMFHRRITDVKEAKLKLEEQRHVITRQVDDMNQNISNLVKAIQEKEGFLALAQTRLEKRSNRPGIELVKDRVEHSLVNEILSIKDSVAELQKLHAEAEKSLRCLLEAQIRLEQEINIKMSSIKIDEVDCMTIRQNINFHSF